MRLPTPREAWLVARMAVCTAVISIAARLLPLPKALAVITPRRRSRSSAFPPARIARLAGLVTRSCWKRAAVMHRYLLLAGVENRVVFGVRRAGESALDGHAWIEVDGQPFGEAAPPDYRVTF